MSLKDSLQEAMQHQLAGRFAAAEGIYQTLLKENPEQPDALHLLGLIRMEQEQDDEAVALMEQALALFPRASHFHHNIAGLYRRMGRLEEAEAEFREAIRLKPDYGEAYQGLAEMVKFQSDDPLIPSIDEQLKREDLSQTIRSYFHFAAGKALDDIGRYQDAFKHYRMGNRLADRKFDNKQFRGLTKEILYHCTFSNSQRLKDAGSDSELPVFVVGMPRSGTTLTEQILASHSAVFGAGELNDMKFIAARTQQLSRFKEGFPASLPGLTSADFTTLGDEYLERINRLTDADKPLRIIDKHPLNFQFVGLILSMFPQAKIIHTVRDPLDTGLSCFFQNFTRGQDYSFDLRSLAFFYNDYRRLMEHWEMLYPGKICTVKYEQVIADQEGETRRMLDYLGLPFESQCVEFHKTERKVSTASFLQVRKPLYKSSQQRWKNYREELREFAQIIGVSIDSPVTISGGSSILS